MRADASHTLVLPLLGAMLLLACGEPRARPTPTEPSDALTLTLVPEAADLAVGDSLTFQVEVRDSQGRPRPGVTLTWTSTPPGLVDLDGAVAVGREPGEATVRVRGGGTEATARIALSRPPARTGDQGIWISPAEIAARPTRGPAWAAVKQAADAGCSTPDLTDQDDPANVCVLANALVYARFGGSVRLDRVVRALRTVSSEDRYRGNSLALGRELAAYVLSADIVDLGRVDPALDRDFRDRLRTLLETPHAEDGGVRSLRECDELRPNNWGTHCRTTRAAIAVYLGDSALLERVATVFRGYLGDREAYAGFVFGDDRSWHCDPARPVGINPAGCTRDGHSIDGVLPDDQRRGGRFTWPPVKENYVYEGLQGALATAVILERAGYPAFDWQDQALLRAFRWLHDQAGYPPDGDDTWQTWVVNAYYGTDFSARAPSTPGKAVGWTDWTLGWAASSPQPG